MLALNWLKSTYADHQTADQWHQSALPQCKTLQSIWIENWQNITRSNSLQGKQITLGVLCYKPIAIIYWASLFQTSWQLLHKRHSFFYSHGIHIPFPCVVITVKLLCCFTGEGSEHRLYILQEQWQCVLQGGDYAEQGVQLCHPIWADDRLHGMIHFQ